LPFRRKSVPRKQLLSGTRSRTDTYPDLDERLYVCADGMLKNCFSCQYGEIVHVDDIAWLRCAYTGEINPQDHYCGKYERTLKAYLWR
jgi:hypothetical protein